MLTEIENKEQWKFFEEELWVNWDKGKGRVEVNMRSM